MRILCSAFLFAALLPAADPADRDAIRQAISAFSHPAERPRVLAHDADIAPLHRFANREASPVWFEVISIRLVTPDVAFVDAVATQFGTLILKRTAPAVFVLKREDGAWKIAVLRLPGASVP